MHLHPASLSVALPPGKTMENEPTVGWSITLTSLLQGRETLLVALGSV